MTTVHGTARVAGIYIDTSGALCVMGQNGLSDERPVWAALAELPWTEAFDDGAEGIDLLRIERQIEDYIAECAGMEPGVLEIRLVDEHLRVTFKAAGVAPAGLSLPIEKEAPCRS